MKQHSKLQESIQSTLCLLYVLNKLITMEVHSL